MNIKVICINLILIFSFSYSFVFGQQAYQEGWKAFQKNDRAEARKYFSQAVSNPEAILSLSLIDMYENKLDDAFENFRKFYESSPNPYPYFYALCSQPYVFSYGKVLNTAQLAFFEKIVNDPKMNGTLKAMIYVRLGEHYKLINNTKKSEENFAKIGAIENWQVVGTFDNVSGSGFNKDWGTVEKAKTNEAFKNKVNADVYWYSPGKNKENKWFSFSYFFNMNDAIMYAQTFVNSPTEQEVYLRAGNSGSLKIWLNDALVSSVSEERNCDLDIYNYKVKLNKGANRILVQIGTSDISRANFLVRLTDEKGIPIPAITSSENYADYTKSSVKYDLAELPFFAEEFFKGKVNSDNSNPLNHILLAETYLRNDKSYQATKVLKNLETVSGKSTLTAYRLYEAFNHSQNKTDTQKEIEYIKKEDPNSFYALQANYKDAVKSEKYDEAENIFEKTKQLYGESEVTDGWAIAIASYQNKFDDHVKLSKELYKKYPQNSDYMFQNFNIEKSVSNNPAKAIEVIENYLKSFNNSDVMSKLATTYLEQGNTKKGLAVLYKRSELSPYETLYYQNMTKILTNMQLYDEALKSSDKALKLAPYESDFYFSRGLIYKNTNNETQAKDNFQKAVYYSPSNYDARTQLRLIDKRKEIFSLFPDSKLQELIAAASNTPENPDDNSLVILNEKQQVIYPEGAREFRYDLAVKILNKSGIEDWKEYTIDYNSSSKKLIVDKAEVIKANGSVCKAESNNNHIVFTNLETNDVLHLEYRMQDYLSGGEMSLQFYDNFQFQYGVPTMVCKFSILVPKDKEFKYKMKNTETQPEIVEIENMKLYTWEMKNMPAIKREPYMSTIYDVAPAVQYSSIPDWKYISDWYKDVTESKFNTDYVLNETFAELIKGKENASKLEKAKIFYNYIRENFTYLSVDFMQNNYVPQKASRTITNRLGDCKDLSTLFVSLCRMADIDANLVLILPRDYGTANVLLPSLNAFNHVIAQLRIDNKTYYQEMTVDYLPFGSVPPADRNAQILPIPFNADVANNKLINLTMPQRTIDKSLLKGLFKITNNDFDIYEENVYYGSLASQCRSALKSLSYDEKLKYLDKNISEEHDTQAKATNLKYSGLDNLLDSVVLSYNVKMSGAIQDVAGMKIFRLPWNNTNSLSIVAAETRKYPLEYWTCQFEDKTTKIITLILPQGKKLVEVPENKQIQCPNAKYSLTFDLKEPGKVIIKRNFERTGDTVSTEDYAKFKEFIHAVNESDNKQYAIK